MNTYIIAYIDPETHQVSSATHDAGSFIEAQADFIHETNSRFMIIGVVKILKGGAIIRATQRNLL